MNKDWSKEINLAVTITDAEGIIIYMNDKAAKTFEKDGGKNLIGTQIKNCHQSRSNEIISKLMNERETNVYTIEKKGVKKLVYQTPWYENGNLMGLVEFSFEIPFEMNHFIR